MCASIWIIDFVRASHSHCMYLPHKQCCLSKKKELPLTLKNTNICRKTNQIFILRLLCFCFTICRGGWRCWNHIIICVCIWTCYRAWIDARLNRECCSNSCCLCSAQSRYDTPSLSMRILRRRRLSFLILSLSLARTHSSSPALNGRKSIVNWKCFVHYSTRGTRLLYVRDFCIKL